MPLPISPSEREQAYQILGVSEQELLEIEKASYTEGEERLKKLKARVRKTFKHLASQYHPDLNHGNAEKASIFALLVRVTKELDGRQMKTAIPGVEPIQQVLKWKVNTSTVTGTKPFIQGNIRRPQPAKRLDPREQAARLGKMRP